MFSLIEGVDFGGIRNEVFKNQSGLIDLKNGDLTVGLIVNQIIPILIVLAGIVLLFLLIAGGFSMMTSAGNPKSTEAAKGKVTSAIVGFLIIFVAYWIVKILQLILGLNQPGIF